MKEDKITFDYVVKHYKIENLNNNNFKKSNGFEKNYNDSNKKWITSQIDFFNSNFTNKKARQDFFLVIQGWYYNFFFKKYLKRYGKQENYTEIIYDTSINTTYKFLETYNRRIRAVCKRTNRKVDLKVVSIINNQLEVREPTEEDISRKVKHRPCSTIYEQFDCIFQAYIGSLASYALAIKPFDTDEESEITYGATLSDNYIYELEKNNTYYSYIGEQKIDE